MLGLERKFHFKNIDSTSAYLLRRRFVLPNFSVVTADYQTAGRGRSERTWYSEKGQNLLFSILIKDKKLVENFSSLSVASAVSVINVLEKLGLYDLSFKWPNDVYVSSEKICGILLQSSSENSYIDSIVIGIGLNVNQTEFNGDYIHSPTSISKKTEKTYSIKKIRNLLYEELVKEFRKIKAGKSDYLKKANKLNYLLGKEVFAEIKGEKKAITVLKINPDNSLEVICGSERLNINSGEVTFHI